MFSGLHVDLINDLIKFLLILFFVILKNTHTPDIQALTHYIV